MYGRAFQNEQIEVITASDGAAAVELAQSAMPDVILMDVMMPVMNGLQALQIIKTTEGIKHIPVVMLSAHEDDALLKQALDLGASRYLLKGMNDPNEVVNTIRELANSSRRPEDA
jgi:CheY-like chemotaxis protein